MSKLISLGEKEPPTRSTSAGKAWQPATVRFHLDPQAVYRELSEATPPNTVLLKWARSTKAAPPQSWWDDQTDPFTPAE